MYFTNVPFLSGLFAGIFSACYLRFKPTGSAIFVLLFLCIFWPLNNDNARSLVKCVLKHIFNVW